MGELKHYLFLATILSLILGLFWIFNFNRLIQIELIIALGIIYVFWGIFYHALKKELHWRVILEYAVVALTAIIVVAFLLLRA